VRGDLLDKLGRHAEAAAEFHRSAELATNIAERSLSIQRARESAARAWRFQADPGSGIEWASNRGLSLAYLSR